MPAQLIVIAKEAGEGVGGQSEKATKEKKKTPSVVAAGEGSGGGEDPYGPYYPIPVRTLNVYGQSPVHIGHFANMTKLLDSVHSRGGLPGGSNTLFASVGDLRGMRSSNKVRSSQLQSRLASLPDELTIIVHEAKRRG
jgi:hypothetical protein